MLNYEQGLFCPHGSILGKGDTRFVWCFVVCRHIVVLSVQKPMRKI